MRIRLGAVLVPCQLNLESTLRFAQVNQREVREIQPVTFLKAERFGIEGDCRIRIEDPYHLMNEFRHKRHAWRPQIYVCSRWWDLDVPAHRNGPRARILSSHCGFSNVSLRTRNARFRTPAERMSQSCCRKASMNLQHLIEELIARTVPEGGNI